MADNNVSTQTHNVFLSWSGEWSKAVAASLRDWMKVTIRGSRPWMSSEDIAKGSAWRSEISGKLATCSIGIVVLTPESIGSSWVAFEAGAMSRAISGKVCTLLCGLDHLTTGPFSEFQDTVCTRDDVLRLCRDVNTQLGGDFLEEWFDADWPKLERALATHQAEFGKGQKPPPAPKADDVLAEILSTVRSLQRQQSGHGLSPEEFAQEAIAHTQLVDCTSQVVQGFGFVGADLVEGSIVEHPNFGRGVVQSVRGGPGGDGPRALIDFGPAGRKTLLLKYARLRKAGRLESPKSMAD